jgi:hypothetical protein
MNITDHRLKFDAEEHEYLYEGVKLDSVTTILKWFKTPFDTETLSKRTAEKRGITQEEILKEWDEKKEFACTMGTDVHDYAESVILKKAPKEPTSPKATKLRATVDKYFKDHPTLTPQFTEIRLAMPVHGVAGTVDLIMKSDNGKTFLYDWKTSKQINQKDFFKKKMRHFLSHLDDCNYVHYSLQMYIYKYMLESKGYKIDGCYVIHLQQKGWKEYKALDLTEEAKAVMEYCKYRRFQGIECEDERDN